jgi:hypothetical protein
MNNDTIKLFIPKELIKKVQKHPEEYGDKIVILNNDMWTDVYEDDDGKYYSWTNDEELIAYVNSYLQK